MNDITMMIIILLFFIGAIYQVLKRSTLGSLKKALTQKDYDRFFKILNSPTTEKVMNTYTCDKLKLRGYVLQKDKIKEKELVNKLLDSNLAKQNLDEFLITYYHYYLDQKDEEYIQLFLRKIEESNDEMILKESKQAYDVLILKKTDMIDEMDKQIEKARGFSLGLIVYLMGMQYLYLGDKKNAQMYFFNALMSLKNTIYEAKAQKYIDELGKELKFEE